MVEIKPSLCSVKAASSSSFKHHTRKNVKDYRSPKSSPRHFYTHVFSGPEGMKMPWEQQWDITFNTHMTHKGPCPPLCHIIACHSVTSVTVARKPCRIPPRVSHTNLTTGARRILYRYLHSPKGLLHPTHPCETS